MDKNNYYYDISLQIFEDEDGLVTYSVIQNFSEKEDDHEVIAYGEGVTPAEAIKASRDAIWTVLG